MLLSQAINQKAQLPSPLAGEGLGMRGICELCTPSRTPHPVFDHLLPQGEKALIAWDAAITSNQPKSATPFSPCGRRVGDEGYLRTMHPFENPSSGLRPPSPARGEGANRLGRCYHKQSTKKHN